MSKSFEAKKKQILSDLALPDHDYTDLSPKGSVDVGILDLLHKINKLDGYVTTSSCAGRIAVYLEGARKVVEDSSLPDAGGTAGVGGKGGGKWLFVSHDTIDLEQTVQEHGSILALCQLSTDEVRTDLSAHQPMAHSKLVHLKFEPMILHILCASLQDSQNALSASMHAGFRESGISGVSGSHPTPLVAIRSAGLAFDSIIGFETAEGRLQPLVSESYLRTLINLGNERFATNTQRKERFSEALFRPGSKDSQSTSSSANWEPAEVRRGRKRAEGLRIREELAQRQKSGQEQGVMPVDDETSLGLAEVLADDV